MKRNLIILLTVLTISCIASTAFAGPFADVPANNWAYSAVNQLAKAGLIDGYGDGSFRGDKAITRYEMAILVAKAIEHADKADAANKAIIEKLTAEYANELQNLGVRVDNLEKKVNTLDKASFDGDFFARMVYYKDQIANPTAANSTYLQERLRLNFQYKLSDNVDIYTRFAERYEYGDTANNLGNNPIDQFGVKYKVNDWDLNLGRQSVQLGQGLIISIGDDVQYQNKFDGLVGSTQWGNTHFKVIAGSTTTNPFDTLCTGNPDLPETVYGFDLSGNITNNATLGVAYADYKLNAATSVNYSAVNGSYKFSPEFSINGEYIKSSVNTDNTGYFIAGTYNWPKDSLTVLYDKIDKNAVDLNNSSYSAYNFTFYGAGVYGAGIVNNYDGWLYIYNHKLSKETSISLSYEDTKISGNPKSDREGDIRITTTF